jgi:hypothetical protein
MTDRIEGKVRETLIWNSLNGDPDLLSYEEKERIVNKVSSFLRDNPKPEGHAPWCPMELNVLVEYALWEEVS